MLWALGRLGAVRADSGLCGRGSVSSASAGPGFRLVSCSGSRGGSGLPGCVWVWLCRVQKVHIFRKGSIQMQRGIAEKDLDGVTNSLASHGFFICEAGISDSLTILCKSEDN